MKQRKVTFTSTNIVNFLYIIYELDTLPQDLYSDFTLKLCFFGAAQLTKNTDLDKYSYLRYGIGFDSRSCFSFPGFNWGKMFLSLELIIILPYILIIRKKLS